MSPSRTATSGPYDPVNYGVIGDAHVELGNYDEAFDAFDRMMALRPGAPSYARVAYARELQGNLTGAIEAMKLAASATSADRSRRLWRGRTRRLAISTCSLARFARRRRSTPRRRRRFPGIHSR